MITNLTKWILIFILVSLITSPKPSYCLTIGTFNVEYFTVDGAKAYSEQDCAYLASLIANSGAEILALQEIEGDRAIETLLKKHLPGWSFAGNQTERKQNLYFIWNSDDIELIAPIEVLFEEETVNWAGEITPLFRRHPIKGTFREKSTGGTFAMITVHLRSLGTAGAADRLAAVAMNNGIRQAQVIKLNQTAQEAEIATFILGDFNSVEVPGATFPFFPLEDGHSYDDFQCTIDHIGYVNIVSDDSWSIKEVETSIPERAVGGRQHPDHDLVVLSMPRANMVMSSY